MTMPSVPFVFFCAAIADAVIEGKTLYDQSLVKKKDEEKAAADSAIEAGETVAVGGV
jgi:hypothetical protein